MKNPDVIIIGSNHPMDRGGAFSRVLEERGVVFEVVDLSKGRYPEPHRIGGIIALGNPFYNSREQIAWYGDLIRSGTPGVGMCGSHQGMGEALGGLVTPAPSAEFGFENMHGNAFRPQLTPEGENDPVLAQVLTEHSSGVVFEFHTAQLEPNPETTLVVARGENDVVQALRAKKADGTPGRMLGVQFHPDLETKEDLETFISIYEEVFGLKDEMKATLRTQHERYQALNTGSLITRRVIDTILE